MRQDEGPESRQQGRLQIGEWVFRQRDAVDGLHQQREGVRGEAAQESLLDPKTLYTARVEVPTAAATLRTESAATPSRATSTSAAPSTAAGQRHLTTDERQRVRR